MARLKANAWHSCLTVIRGMHNYASFDDESQPLQANESHIAEKIEVISLNILNFLFGGKVLIPR